MIKALLGSLSLLVALLSTWSAFSLFVHCILPWRKSPDTTTSTIIVAGMQFTGWQMLVPVAANIIVALAFAILGLWILKRHA